MKLSKRKLSIVFIVIVVAIILVGRFGYSIGQHNASLTIKKASPKQLVEAMQADNFYGAYTKTMLLVTGTVTTVTKSGTGTRVQFLVTHKPTVLGKVVCDVTNRNNSIKPGDVIRVLTVAYDAQRQNKTDVFMPNCYLLNN